MYLPKWDDRLALIGFECNDNIALEVMSGYHQPGERLVALLWQVYNDSGIFKRDFSVPGCLDQTYMFNFTHLMSRHQLPGCTLQQLLSVKDSFVLPMGGEPIDR